MFPWTGKGSQLLLMNNKQSYTYVSSQIGSNGSNKRQTNTRINSFLQQHRSEQNDHCLVLFILKHTKELVLAIF